MQLLQNYCKNFCKIFDKCINIDKLLENFCESFVFSKFLQELCVFSMNFFKSCVFLEKFCNSFFLVWTNHFHNVFVIALKQSDTYVSKFRVFLYKKLKGILQSNQNPAFHVGSEKRQEWSDPKGRDRSNCEKNVSFCISIQTNWASTKPMHSENSLSLMLSKLFDYKMRSKGVNCIKFYL